MPSINSFFTMQRQCDHGSRCMKRKEGNGIVTKSFRWLNGRNMPYPDHLKENMPKICPNSWVVDQIQEKYVMSSRNPRGEDLDALNIGIRCNKSIITSLSTMFYL
jgi:hypothetical protein